MAEKRKKRWGDRRDGRLVREIDGMHAIMPYIYLNRADNEAFIQEQIELAPINAYLEKKNAELKDKVEKGLLPKEALDDPYKLFQVILAATVKTITLRPKMNYFIQGRRVYERNHISLGFTVKKRFADDAGEGLAFKIFGPETTMDSLHEEIVKEINACKDESKADNTIDAMNTFAKIPRFILRPVIAFIRMLDFYGKAPYSLVKTDPNYATVFLTNLGSIKLKAGYHHLSNWGTTSIFVILGEKKMKPFYKEDGTFEVREVMDIGLTLDERIADGYYYSRTVKLLKKLLANPELLDERADAPVEY